MSTAFHPQTDGQTERMNRTLEEMLRIYATYEQDQWDEYLPAVEFAYNNSKNISTGFTPFELDCGYHPNTPTSIASNSLTNTKVATANEFVDRWNTMMKIAKDTLLLAQERQSKYANQHRRHIEYKIGDKVLLSTQNICSSVDKGRPAKKFNPKYIGPYKIAAEISKTAYKLELPTNLKIHPVFHVSLLKPYKESDEFEREIRPPPVFITEDNQEEYEVEKILDKRIIRKKPQYLVKWLGYPLYDATWEPVENLKNCQEKVKEYESTRTLNSKEGRM